jgi:HSP20 family protein
VTAEGGEGTKDGGVYRSERSSFSRSIFLPFRIDGAKVDAELAKGVLTVTVPKPAEAVQETKKVKIKA